MYRRYTCVGTYALTYIGTLSHTGHLPLPCARACPIQPGREVVVHGNGMDELPHSCSPYFLATRNLSRHRNQERGAPRPRSRRSKVLVPIRLLRLAQRSGAFSAELTDSVFVCPFFTSGQVQPFSRSAMQPCEPWSLPKPPPQSQRSRDDCWSLPDGSPRQSVQPGPP